MFSGLSKSTMDSPIHEEEVMLVTNPFAARTFARDAVKSVSSGWWALFAVGILSTIAGGLILAIDWSVGDLAVFLGTLLVVRGLLTTFSIPLDGGGRGWAIAMGLLEVGVGIAMFAWPEPTLLVVAGFIGWWVLFSGVMTIAGSISGRDFVPYWGLWLALGIGEVVVAFWLLEQPGLTLVSTVLAIGLWSMFSGIVLIAASFELKNLPKRFETATREFSAASYPDSRVPAANVG
jgi:uncharacterized membrane protein HdeD (DUF308 family)